MGLGYEKLNDDNIPILLDDEPQSIQQQPQQQQLPHPQQLPQFGYPQAPIYNPYSPQQQYYLQPQQPQHQPIQPGQQVPPQFVYPPVPNVVVTTSQSQDEADFTPSLVFFVGGFFIWCLWFINIKYLKSRNRNAKTLATLSVIFGVVYLVLVLFILIPLAVQASNRPHYSYNYSS